MFRAIAKFVPVAVLSFRPLRRKAARCSPDKPPGGFLTRREGIGKLNVMAPTGVGAFVHERVIAPTQRLVPQNLGDVAMRRVIQVGVAATAVLFVRGKCPADNRMKPHASFRGRGERPTGPAIAGGRLSAASASTACVDVVCSQLFY